MDSIIFVIIVIGIFGGFIIGGVTGYAAGKKKSKPSEKVMASSFVQSKDTMQSSLSTLSPEAQAQIGREGYRSLAHLWRRKNEAGLTLEVDGNLYSDRSSLPKEKIQALREIGHEWMVWLGEEENTEQHLDSEPVMNTGVSEPVETGPQKEKTVTPPPVQSPTFVEVITKKIEITPSHTNFKEVSIPEQIDEILQQKLEESGVSGRNIRIIEDLNHNVIFQVDQKSYTGIDTVDDPEAASLIRQAISEWEKRSKPLHRR